MKSPLLIKTQINKNINLEYHIIMIIVLLINYILTIIHAVV